MTTTQAGTIAELQRTIADLRHELNERDAALTKRASRYGEHAAQQAATIDVLKVMSASPGDPQPVFDLIVERACACCGAELAALTLLDGDLLRLNATSGMTAARTQEFATAYPLPVSQAFAGGRAILTRDTVQVPDTQADPGFAQRGTNAWHRSVLAVPLLRAGMAVGAIGLGRSTPGAFSAAQVELLKTFAEQAVIAIGSAETYRVLRTRTADLQETLEYQTATSEVLKVISRSTFDLQPVLDTVAQTAARLCDAEQAVIFRFEGEQGRLAANFGFPPEYEAFVSGPEAYVIRLSSDTPNVGRRAAREGRPVHIHDVTTVPGYPDAAIRLGKQRTSLGVPLLREGEAIGVIVLARQRVEPFTERQIEVVSTFADQAVIAIENTRLLTEQQEALDQQTATAEVLQVINAAPGDLTQVFAAMLEKAMRLCAAAFGYLLTYDGERFRTVAHYGLPPRFAEYLPRMDQPGSAGAYARILDGAPLVHVTDLRDGDVYRTSPLRQALVDLGGARTGLIVALRKEDRLLGIFTIYRQEVRQFSDKQIALLENFAAQAVIAMENARLLTEQREALEQQTATAEVLQVINASPGNLAPVFDAMLEKAMRLCGAVCGGLFTYDGERFHTMATLGVPAAAAEFRTKYPPTSQPGSGIARLLKTRRTDQILDRMAEEDYRSGEPGARAMVELGGARTMLNVPLLKNDEVVGFFSVYRDEVRAFSGKQIALLENFAAQAVIAMESARLLSELRSRTDELAQRQAELRVTFENMGDGVAMFDETSRLVAWNRKFQDIFDLPDGVLAERLTFPDYIRYLTVRGEYGAEADPEEQIRRLTGQVDEYRAYERARPDGRVIEIRRNPVAGGGFVLIYTDITERKRNEAEISAARDAAEEASRTIEVAFRELKAAQANLIQAEKMASLGQLTAGIAHEIKNPLNFVNNFAALSVDLLGELKATAAPGFAALSDDQRTEIDDISEMLTSNLEKITEHGKRADGIVKAMLEHSRGSSTERRLVDLNALIDEALNLAYHGARAQDQSFNITLERNFGEGIAPIEVNPQDMTRVFLNIFGNGFYATRTRARSRTDNVGFVPMLKVTTRDAGEVVEIRVRDNGTGIPVEIRDKLFQPFFTTKPTGEGTGLGLSITYDIVMKQHGGTITVDSEVDAFTEFVVTLPRQMFSNGDGRA